ncbi:MAG: hypothetical protein Q7U56_08410 [Humidesulfovibrio sp.]|nr:hypothetical protein [Desulfovibrio sp.]MDO9083291.1 hypothetical protein [Humidesulfovibrio sp.]
MSKTPSPEPSVLPGQPSQAALAPPMGMLFTLLRHGRGLSEEDALRRSWEPAAPLPQQPD